MLYEAVIAELRDLYDRTWDSFGMLVLELRADNLLPLVSRLREEFERATRAVLRITESARLLDHHPVLQRTIARRNPYIDPLNFVQADLLRQRRSPHSEADEAEILHALLLSVNGIAAGMRNTG